jgi:basic membrane protein A
MRKVVTGLVAVAALVASSAAAQDFKPAIIFDMGGKFDKSFNEAAYNGAERFKPRPASTISSSR